MIEEVTIKFSTPKIGLDKVEIAVPQPATNYISEMWKNTPLLMPQDKQEWDLFVDKNIGEDSRKHTAKTCPSFIDIWKSGYVVPAPCDLANALTMFDVEDHAAKVTTDFKTPVDLSYETCPS